MSSLRALLWIDCCAGAAVGSVGLTLTASGFLSSLAGLPVWLLVLVGSANLVYAACSFSIVHEGRQSAWAVRRLVQANAVWALVCVFIAIAFFADASLFGMAYLLGEAAFVAGLAYLEWRALGYEVAAT